MALGSQTGRGVDAYPEAWPHAKRAWQGVLTVKMTKSLIAYGRGEA